MGTQIHELIAVEKDAKNEFDKVLGQNRAVLTQAKIFNGSKKTYKPDDADDRDLPEGEHIPMRATVQQVINSISVPIARLLDLSLQKESANTKAQADLVVIDEKGGEKVLQKNVPVTVLVQLEGYMTRVIQTMEQVPTLDGALEWNDNNEKIPNTWITKPIERVRTRKVPTVLKCAAATTQHKEQYEVIHVDKTVGKWETVHISGALSETQKIRILQNCKAVLEGIKRARSRANTTEIDKGLKIGGAINNFIFG